MKLKNMDPDKKQLIIMLGVVGLLLVVVGLLVFWPEGDVATPSPQSSPSAGEGGKFFPSATRGGDEEGGREGLPVPPGRDPASAATTTYNLPPKTLNSPTPDQQDSAAMLASARSFAEFFGTYSSEAASFSNVNLVDLATPSFEKWYAGAWQKLRAGFPKGTYYAVTTRALSTKIASHDPVAGKASVEVSVQQEESGGQATSVSYPTLQLELVRPSGVWLIDRASWK